MIKPLHYKQINSNMIRSRFKAMLLVLLFVAFHFKGFSQDLEKIKESKAITVGGGISANATYVGATGTDLKRDPFYWQLNANLNFNFFGVVSAPFSATVTKENKTFNQPSYKRFGISPKYKFITAHIGHRSMSFSSYSLAGLTFLGGGLEITPEEFPVKFSAMYGRFNKAVEFINTDDIEEEQVVVEPPSYERRGYGCKLTVGKNKHSADVIFFKAKDMINSITDTIPDIKPEENVVFGLNTRNNITEKLSFNAEYSISAYTYDISMPETEFETYTYVNNLGDLFTPRESTQVKNAIMGKLNYQFTFADIALMYRRVDPNYRSMGAPGMVGDIEEYTVNVSTSLFDNKLGISGNIGSQRNNIDKVEDQAMKRFIASISLNYSPVESLSFSGNYSNFSARILPSRISYADSIKYVQVTENVALSGNYNINGTALKHNISLMGNYQSAVTTNRTLTDTLDTDTKMFSSNLNYQMNFAESNFSLNLAVNYSNFNSDDNKNSNFGPTLGLSKSFLGNKMQSSLNYSYFFSKSSDASSSPINNLSLSFNYKINSHNSLRLSGRYMYKKDTENGQIQKFQANLVYNFTF